MSFQWSSKCILPEVYPNISFDANGECNYCKSHQKANYLGESRLKQELAKYKKAGGKYDCLVPVSGGKDSTFVLYQMSTLYKMRVLAFNYDNCLTHPQAQRNVRENVNSLGVDLVTKRNEKQKKYMLTNLKAYLRKPSVGMVPMLCTGCRYGIIGNAFNVAKEYDIPMIVIGWSPIENTLFKELFLRKNGHSVKGELIRNLIKNPSYIRPGNIMAAAKDYYHNYQHVKDWNMVLKMLHPGIKLIQFYDYITHHPDKIQSILEKEIGWKVPDKKDSWQWDCKIKLFQSYFYEKEVTFTASDDYLSSQIREGFITRSEALDRLEYLNGTKKQKLNQIHEVLRDFKQEKLIRYFA